MNLPARLRHWEVHGETLAIEGTGADVIIDWIADDEDETAKSQINRLMGVIIVFILTSCYRNFFYCFPVCFIAPFFFLVPFTQVLLSWRIARSGRLFYADGDTIKADGLRLRDFPSQHFGRRVPR